MLHLEDTSEKFKAFSMYSLRQLKDGRAQTLSQTVVEGYFKNNIFCSKQTSWGLQLRGSMGAK